MREKALNLLGMMRKANAVQIGETNTGASVRGDKAKLVIVASDASNNALSRAEGFVYGRKVPMIIVPFTKEEISMRVGKNGCSMAAVCDIGFADAFMKCLTAEDSEKYSEVSEIISAELKKANKLRRENSAHDRNKRTGKRRNNA